MKTALSKHLAKYSALAGTLFLVKNANSQIVYTDIDPDFVGSGNIDYQLDLNNDGVFDFGLNRSFISYYYHGYWEANSCRPFNRIQQYSTLYGFGDCDSCLLGSNEINKLNAGNSIAPNVQWFKGANMDSHQYRIYSISSFCSSGSAEILSFYSTDKGNWVGATDQFLGVRVFKDDHYYYGWIRMSVNYTTYTVKDYAINAIPDSPILAGQIENCTAPTGLIVGQITNTSAKVKWDVGDGKIAYNFAYRQAGSSNWISYNASKSRIQLQGLLPSSKYFCKVRMKCEPSIQSAWSPGISFTTLPQKIENSGNESIEAVEIFPNPVNDVATIAFSVTENSEVTIDLLDLQGRKIKSVEKGTFEAGSHQIIFSVSNLSAGTYFLRIKTSEGISNKKVVVTGK